MKILSIIIPTYNMENYLRRCLDSLLVKEHFENLEVWVVNDGSKDNSSVIAHEYETKYPGVFNVLDKPNGNYGSCINAALPRCTGKYVKVLDADDWFDTAEFEKMLGGLKEVDASLVLTNMTYVYANGYKRVQTYPFDDNKQYDCTIMSSESFIKMQMHAVAYRTKMLQKMDYKQTEGISYTDQEWIFYPMVHVQDIAVLNLNVYQYLKGREGQTMDAKVMLKNISHSSTILKKMVLFWSTLDKQHLQKDKTVYLRTRIIRLLRPIYKMILLSDNVPAYIDVLNSLDAYIKNTDKGLYAELSQQNLTSFWPYKYIARYQNTGKGPSGLIVFLYRLLDKAHKLRER